MPNKLNNDNSDIDLIEKYHRGLLIGAELDDFLKREKGDKDFAQKVRSYTDILGGIDYYVKQKGFADTIQGWEKEIKEHSKKKHYQSLPLSPAEPEQSTIPINRNNVFWLAAACVSLLIVSGIILFRSATPDLLAVYETYYQPYPNVFEPTMRGETVTVSLNKQAFRAYDQGHYAIASKYFKRVLVMDNKTEKDIALLYLANCYLAQDSVAAAKDILIQIDEQSPVADQARWYLSLAYLKLNDPGHTRKILNELKDRPNSYQNKANRLLQEIK